MVGKVVRIIVLFEGITLSVTSAAVACVGLIISEMALEKGEGWKEGGSQIQGIDST